MLYITRSSYLTTNCEDNVDDIGRAEGSNELQLMYCISPRSPSLTVSIVPQPTCSRYK